MGGDERAGVSGALGGNRSWGPGIPRLPVCRAGRLTLQCLEGIPGPLIRFVDVHAALSELGPVRDSDAATVRAPVDQKLATQLGLPRT